jgi:hypothetical protein
MTQAISLKQRSDPTSRLIIHTLLTNETTGLPNANVDGSVTPVRYILPGPLKGCYQLAQLIVAIGGTGQFSDNNYGTIPRLVNGVALHVEDQQGVSLELLFGVGVKDNYSWNALAGGNFDAPVILPPDEGFYLVRYDLTLAGLPIRIVNGETLVATIQDDLTGLSEHIFGVQGVLT